jgi:hypothetical protein
MCYAVNQLSQVMVRLTKLYWKVTKNVLRYLKSTSQYGLCYKQIEGMKLQGFIDAAWAGSQSDRKNTLGGVFSIMSTIVSYYSRKQISVALSSAKAKYIAVIQEACDGI